jgi:hypothetical protein
MSYEIYEKVLVRDSGEPMQLNWLLQVIEHSGRNELDEIKRIKILPDKNLQTFLFRARRGGLDLKEIIREIQEYSRDDGEIETSDGRFSFIKRLMAVKARKEGKTIYGGKIDIDPYVLHRHHPQAIFFIMIRDIRDVYASMCNTGSFKYSAEEAASLWKKRILEFREFANRDNVKAMEICYEKLVWDPKTTLKRVCQFVGVDYSQEMLSYHKKEMTLFQNPHGHLSYAQLKKGLNTESVGRWKRDLNVRDVESLLRITGDSV